MGGYPERGAIARHRIARTVGWGAAVLVLLAPLVAMQYTDEVHWTIGDFVVAAGLLGAVGIGFELALRASRSLPYRAGAALALADALLITWANGAVGIIGSERDPFNLVFTGIVLLAVLGAAVARFRAAGLAIAMLVVAGAQLAAALAGFVRDPRGAVLSGVFVVAWLAAAALFRHAARADDQRRR